MRENIMLTKYLYKVASGGWEKQSIAIIFNSEGGMEKRIHPRISMDNISVDVTDGVGSFRGLVSDISRFGVCLTDLPKKLNGSVSKMIVVVSAKEQHFKMSIKPRWYTDGGVTKSVGALILNAPLGWTEFVMGFEPVIQKDVWGEIRL
jgi:hypothetical protein